MKGIGSRVKLALSPLKSVCSEKNRPGWRGILAAVGGESNRKSHDIICVKCEFGQTHNEMLLLRHVRLSFRWE